MWKYNCSDELKHVGVIGMKWGNRKKSTKIISTIKKTKESVSQDSKELNNIKNKKINQLSNQELKKANERMNLEQNYSRLNPSNIKKGMALVAATAGTMNTALNLYNNSDQLIKAGKKIYGKLNR